MTENVDAAELWMEIEDLLIPSLGLDAHERSVYYHLARHSRVVGKRTVQISIDSLAAKTGLSTHVREKLRSLEAKGCIKILQRHRSGTTVEVFAPREIPGCEQAATPAVTIDIETFDFFKDAHGRAAILAREGGHCFYCIREINETNAALDHAVPQVNNLDHSYRNIVGCCHECNSLKAGTMAEDFLRLLYRRGRLSASELETRLAILAALARGELKPQLRMGGSQ